MRRFKNGDNILGRAKKRMEESADEAGELAKNPGKLQRLISNAKEKLMGMDERRHTLKNVVRYLSVFIRMIKDYNAGYYPRLPWKSLLSIVGVIMYFINPFDIIPDFIPGIGLLDDVTLLAYVYRSIENDVEDYLDWEQSNA